MSLRRVPLSFVLVVAGGLLAGGCGSGAGSSDSTGTGGAAATGGATGTGGAATSGTGGRAQGTGGATGSGGAATGGATGSGGEATGGAGTGGAPGSGGAATGGATASGGSGTGGVPGSGGAAGRGSGGHAGGAGQSGGAGHGGTGTGGGHAGASGTGGQAGAGASGAGGLGPEAPGGRITGYGTVLISANSPKLIVRLQTAMVVPPEPPKSGTLFLWPGLQPNGANFDPINNGVLQPVLTWGPSCAPGKAPASYSTWWISGQYVNTNGSQTGYTGCNGGTIMSVAVGDKLDMDISLSGTIWTQTVTDERTSMSVAYSIDMMNQAQNLAYFVIEEYSSAPVSEVIFTDTIITFGSADAADCKLSMRGQNDYVSVPVASSDGLTCTIQEIILRAQGIQ